RKVQLRTEERIGRDNLTRCGSGACRSLSGNLNFRPNLVTGSVVITNNKAYSACLVYSVLTSEGPRSGGDLYLLCCKSESSFPSSLRLNDLSANIFLWPLTNQVAGIAPLQSGETRSI